MGGADRSRPYRIGARIGELPDAPSTAGTDDVHMSASSRSETKTEQFQITPEAAELYEVQFVPGIFAEWAPRLVEFAGVAPGQHVADVACGTGIVGRAAARAVGDRGRVVGIDLNPAMLDVARRVAGELEWRQGDVADLPLADDEVDVALCQMAFMFFPDRPRAVAEMARVARRRIALLVPAAIDDQPAYRLFTEVVTENAGPEGASLVAAYWSAGDLDVLVDQLRNAGLAGVASDTVIGTASFDSVDALVATEVEGSPLFERIDHLTYEAIREGCRAALAPFATPTGRIEAPLACHLVRAETRQVGQ